MSGFADLISSDFYTKDKVIDYNNQYRVILGLPKRHYDETHNRLIK